MNAFGRCQQVARRQWRSFGCLFSTRSVGLILAVAFKPRLAVDEWPRRVSDE